MPTHTDVAAFIYARLEETPPTPQTAALRTTVDTCVRLLDMGYALDDPTSATYRDGYLNGILTPIAQALAGHPDYLEAEEDPYR